MSVQTWCCSAQNPGCAVSLCRVDQIEWHSRFSLTARISVVATSQHAMIKPTTCGRWRGVRSRPKPRPPGALALGTGLSARGRALAHAIGASARAASRRQTRGDAAARRTTSSCRLRGFHRTPEAPPCAPILRTRRRRARTHAHRALETRPCGGAAARTRPGCAPYARRWEA